MLGIGFFRKKSNSEEALKLDESLIREGKLDIPPPPSPTSTGGLDFPDHPNYSDEQEKVVLPPVEEERPELPPVGNLNSLDPSWTEFLKQNSEPEEALKLPGPELPQPIEQADLPEKGKEQADPDIERPKAWDLQPKAATPRPEPRFEARKPIFIESETYSNFIEEIGRIRVKLQLVEGVISRIDTLREKEEIELRKWHQGMDEMRKKFLFIDDALFGG
jgi:hypothetical protein